MKLEVLDEVDLRAESRMRLETFSILAVELSIENCQHGKLSRVGVSCRAVLWSECAWDVL